MRNADFIRTLEQVLAVMRELDQRGLDLNRLSVTELRKVLVPPPQAPAALATNTVKTQDKLEWLNTNPWPAAVSPAMICNPNDENEKTCRAAGILDAFSDTPVEGKKVLDVGCGQGHVVMEAVKSRAKFAIGYDIKTEGNLAWNKRDDRSLLTTNFQDVVKNGPYDIIFLYDVLDHCAAESPIDLLLKVRQVCSDTTRVYVRCHPWIGRHGGHAYNVLNKAWGHLFLSDEELRAIGVQDIPTQRLVYPLETYNWWFRSAGFTPSIVKFENHPIEEPVYTSPNMQAVLKVLYPHDNNRFFSFLQLEHSFTDYRLIPDHRPSNLPSPGVFAVARWKHFINGNQQPMITLDTSGNINGGPATWSLANNMLSLNWPSPDAPMGAWVDNVKLSLDRRSYQGKNNSGINIHGIMGPLHAVAR